MAKKEGTGYVLRSTKPNGPVFEILAYDPDTKIGTLKGTGAVFKHSLDKEHVKKYGYRIEPKPQTEGGAS